MGNFCAGDMTRSEPTRQKLSEFVKSMEENERNHSTADQQGSLPLAEKPNESPKKSSSAKKTSHA